MSGRINDWGRSGRCRKRGRAEGERERERDALVEQEKKVRKEGKKICDVHTGPNVAADAVRADGCRLANHGETHGDAALRALIINGARAIMLNFSFLLCTLMAVPPKEEPGISIY